GNPTQSRRTSIRRTVSKSTSSGGLRRNDLSWSLPSLPGSTDSWQVRAAPLWWWALSLEHVTSRLSGPLARGVQLCRVSYRPVQPKHSRESSRGPPVVVGDCTCNHRMEVALTDSALDGGRTFIGQKPRISDCVPFAGRGRHSVSASLGDQSIAPEV